MITRRRHLVSKSRQRESTGLQSRLIGTHDAAAVWLSVGADPNLVMPESTAGDVIRGITPFVRLMIRLAALLYVFPEITPWLPRQMMTGPW